MDVAHEARATLGPSAHVDTFCRDSLPPPQQWPDLVFPLPELQYPPRLNCAQALLDGPDPDRRCLLGPDDSWTYGELRERVGPDRARAGRRPRPGARQPGAAARAEHAVAGRLLAGGDHRRRRAVATMPLLRPGELRVDRRDHPARAGAVRRPVHRRSDRRAARPADRHLRPADDLADRRHRAVRGGRDRGRRRRAARGHLRHHRRAEDHRALPPRRAGDRGHVLRGTCCGRRRTTCSSARPPLAFTFGLGGELVFPLRAGAATLLVERPTPDELADAIAEHGVTVLFTAPTAYRAMLAPAGRERWPGCGAACRPASRCRSRCRRRSTSATGLRIIDGIGSHRDAAHLHLRRRRRRPPGLHRPPGPRVRGRGARRRRPPGAGRRDRPARGQRPDRLPLPRRPAPGGLRPARLEHHRRHLPPRRRRLLLVRRPAATT